MELMKNIKGALEKPRYSNWCWWTLLGDFLASWALVALFPAEDKLLQALLFGFAGFACLFPNIALRLIFPLVAMGTENVLARLTIIMGSTLEKDYVPFLAASLFWAVYIPKLRKGKNTIQQAALTASHVFFAAAWGYLMFYGGDHLVRFFVQLFPFTYRGFSSRTHIAFLGVMLLVAFLAGSAIYRIVYRPKNSTTTAYAWSVLSCCRDMLKLGRKWKF